MQAEIRQPGLLDLCQLSHIGNQSCELGRCQFLLEGRHLVVASFSLQNHMRDVFGIVLDKDEMHGRGLPAATPIDTMTLITIDIRSLIAIKNTLAGIVRVRWWRRTAGQNPQRNHKYKVKHNMVTGQGSSLMLRNRLGNFAGQTMHFIPNQIGRRTEIDLAAAHFRQFRHDRI